MPRKNAGKYDKEGFTNCNCGKKNFCMFMHKVFSLDIEFFSVEDVGFMTGWTLYDDEGEVISSTNQDNLINFLTMMVSKYGLERHSNSCIDKIIIYVDDIKKVLGFYRDHVTSSFSNLSCTLINYFEFRSFKQWNKKMSTEEAAHFMQKIVNEIFVPEKYFYLTPNQRTRKLLQKACRKEGCSIAKEIFPETASSYFFTREALFGGICYCPIPGVIKEIPMMELDIKSAYIYSLLTQKFPISRIEDANPEHYEYYINNEYETALGVYKITYTTSNNIISCYKYYDDENHPVNLKKGKNVEVTITMNSIDLEIFLNLPRVYITSVECLYLEAYKLDYLPKYVRDRLVIEYIKKSEIDEDTQPELYSVQKKVLNGIYGNTIKKLLFDNYKKKASKAYLAPQWGIWTTSYTKQLLLGLALKVSTWLYSDTDSIYCAYSEDNLALLEEYNKKITTHVASICSKFDLDYSKLKDLGKFDLKHKIKKFKALCQKEYLYTTEVKEIDEVTGEEVIKDVIIVKAAGCNKEQMRVNDNLYNLDKLPVGNRSKIFIQPEDRSCTIGGVTYTSKGSCYEVPLTGDDARLMMYAIDQIYDSEEDLF